MIQFEILIADENILFRRGVISTLSNLAGISSFIEIGSLEDLTDELSSNDRPRVLVMNLLIDKGNGLKVVADLSKRFPQLPIIVLGSVAEETFAGRAMGAGCSSYLNINCNTDELINAIHSAQMGKIYLTSRGSAGIAAELQNRSGPSSLCSKLSDREHQILMMICKGMPLVKIGMQFNISVKTVSTYRSRILKKMQLLTNADLIQYAMRSGLIETHAG